VFWGWIEWGSNRGEPSAEKNIFQQRGSEEIIEGLVYQARKLLEKDSWLLEGNFMISTTLAGGGVNPKQRAKNQGASAH